MPEVSEDATILIATSWQALGRANHKNEKTELCNCIIVIVFSAFFIEANLNQIIEKMGKTKEMNNFINKDYPGLQSKIGWFYNEFIARSKALNRKQLFNKSHNLKQKMSRCFPGFYELYNFRNNISHGHIDKSITNFEKSEKLRNQAKKIVDKLFKIAEKNNYKIKRIIPYEVAILN